MGGDIKLINKFLSYILRNDSNTAILDLDNPTFIIRINFDYKNACFVVNKYSYRENIIFSKYEALLMLSSFLWIFYLRNWVNFNLRLWRSYFYYFYFHEVKFPEAFLSLIRTKPFFSFLKKKLCFTTLLKRYKHCHYSVEFFCYSTAHQIRE